MPSKYSLMFQDQRKNDSASTGSVAADVPWTTQAINDYLPTPVAKVLNYDLSLPLRRAVDKVVPDLDLRVQDRAREIQAQQPIGGLSKYSQAYRSPQDQAKADIFAKLDSGEIKQNWLTGFTSSALSSGLELFGMPTPVESHVFRVQNPWTGLASQLVGPVGVYGAAFKFSKMGKMATGLDVATKGTLGFFGKTTLANPIIAGGVREGLRYAPLELTRLGVGLTVWPENSDNLMGEVARDAAIGVAMGGAGGWLRSQGASRAYKRVKGLVEKKIGMQPTFELRLMKDKLAKFEEGVDKDGLIQEWTSKVLNARPGRRTAGQDESIIAEKPFWNLGSVTEEAQGILKNMFESNSSRKTDAEIAASGLDVQLLGTGKGRVGKRASVKVAQAFGGKDLSDLASNFVFPRLVGVTTNQQAGRMAKAFDASPDLRWHPEDQVMIGKDGEGLWVVAKRLSTTGEKVKTPHGTMEIREGDSWFVAKTDRLDLVAPKTHKVVSGRIADWAQMNARFRPGVNPDPFNGWMDTTLASMNPTDWAALKGGTKGSGVARIATRLKAKALEEGNLVDSVQLRKTAESIYDVMVPTARKEASDPVYQRLWGMLKGVSQHADEINKQIMKGVPRMKGSPIGSLRNSKNIEYKQKWSDLETVESLVKSLSPDELQLVANATQVGGSDVTAVMEELAESGMISARGRDVVRQLQEINKRLVNEYVMPALRNSGVGDEFKWLEGYIMPRVYRGDYFIDIKQGRSTVFRVSGRTGQEAQAIAENILAEARDKGAAWTQGETRVFKENTDQGFSLESILDQAAPVGSGDKTVQDIVQGGLKRAMAARPGIPKVNAPGSIMNKRTDLKVADQTWTAEDMIQAIGNHNKQLLQFTANKAWYHRWYPELQSWGEAGNKAMKADLERKSAQLVGIELGLSKAQNNALSQLLGLQDGKSFTKLAGSVNSAMYHMSLGMWNINFALLNVVSPLMTNVPWVSFMQSAPRHKQLQFMQYLPEVGANGRVGGKGFFSFLDPLKTFAQGMKVMAKPDALDRKMIDRALGDGVLDAQVSDAFVGGVDSSFGSSLKESFASGGAWKFVQDLSSMPANKSEQFGRLTAFSTSLALGRNYFGIVDEEQLYRFAKKATEQSMYGYGLVDRPRIMTGPMGSLVGLFKNWQFHYMNQMAEYAGLAVRDNVWAPMLWMMGMTGAVGGLGALPLKGVVDGFVNIATNGETKSAFEWLNQNWGEDHPLLADTVYFGLPGMLGATLQGSATMPGTDIVQDTTNLTNVVAWERAKQMVESVNAMREYSNATGDNGFSNDGLRAQFLGAFMPRSVARLYAITEQDAIISMRSGYPTVTDVSPTSKMLYGLGVNQTDVDRYQIQGRMLYERRETMKSMIQSYGEAYVDAANERKYDRMHDIVQEVHMLGLPIDSVMSSAATRDERGRGDTLSQYGVYEVNKSGINNRE